MELEVNRNMIMEDRWIKNEATIERDKEKVKEQEAEQVRERDREIIFFEKLVHGVGFEPTHRLRYQNAQCCTLYSCEAFNVA